MYYMKKYKKNDIDKLFKLFEDSNFLYKEKKEKLDIERAKSNIAKSFNGNHHKPFFVYSDGKLIGHIAMLNLHGGTWLSHHHCSVRYGAGIEGVSDLSLYVANHYNDMNYMMSFYQPHKEFTRRIWEGIYNIIDKKEYCDIYPFGLVTRKFKSYSDDYRIFKYHYSNSENSNLLYHAFLNILGGDQTLQEETGIYSYRKVFRVVCSNESAIVIKYKGSYGLSLSHYNNCFYVISETGKPVSDRLISFIRVFSDSPILRYPIVDGDKPYNCWIMPTTEEAGLQYFTSLEKIKS